MPNLNAVFIVLTVALGVLTCVGAFVWWLRKPVPLCRSLWEALPLFFGAAVDVTRLPEPLEKIVR